MKNRRQSALDGAHGKNERPVAARTENRFGREFNGDEVLVARAGQKFDERTLFSGVELLLSKAASASPSSVTTEPANQRS
jgi:hypothetical protein